MTGIVASSRPIRPHDVNVQDLKSVINAEAEEPEKSVRLIAPN